jgi:hypothetical protein
MNTPRIVGSLLLLVCALACDSTPSPGAKGGECRIGTDPCNDDLLCWQGECSDPEDVPPQPLTEEAFVATVQLTKTTLKADGVDSAIFAFTLLDRKTGKPTTLPGVFLRTHPINAGVLSDSRLALENGEGVVSVRACDVRYNKCPPAFRIVLVTDAFPTEPILQSPEITYTGLPAVDTDATTGAGGSVATVDAGTGGTGGTPVVTLDAGTGGTPAQDLPTDPEMQAVLDQLIASTEDCDAAAAQYDGPAKQLAKDVCLMCREVWRNGGAGVVTTALQPDPATGTAVPSLIHKGVIRNLAVDQHEGAVPPQHLTGTVSAGGEAPGNLVFDVPLVLGDYTSGCNVTINATGLPRWFNSPCETLAFTFCGSRIATIRNDDPAALWAVDSNVSYCTDADGMVVTPGQLDPIPRLFMCVNTFTR